MWYLAHGLFRRAFLPSINAYKPDVVHGHDGLALPLTIYAAQANNAHSVFDSHELETHRNHPLIWAMSPRIKVLERRFLPRTDAVLTVSTTIAEHLEECYGIPRPTVLYNAPPLAPAPLPERWQTSRPRSTVRQEAGVSTRALLLVYTGNIAAGRGIEQTLQHLAALRPSARKIHLSLVGSVNPAFRAQLEAKTAQLGLSAFVRFHGSVPASDVARFISDADIAVLPILPSSRSHQYAMPNKLFEALQANLPILGTELVEMSAFLKTHRLGVSYNPFSADSFGAALEQILQDREPTSARRARAMKVAQEYSWEVQGDKLCAVYESLVPEPEKNRIAMIVPNPCDPDYRVVKQAQTLVQAGYQVRVFCTRPSGSDLPSFEIVNGVEYTRLDWSTRAIITLRWLR